MKRVEDFEWNDLVLYAKGWYRSECGSDEDRFFAEVARALDMNEHRTLNAKKWSKKKITVWVLKALDKLVKEGEVQQTSLSRFLAEPVSLMTAAFDWQWRAQTYYGNDVSTEYAICQVVLEVFRELDNAMIKLKRPEYGPGRWRMGCLIGEQPPISMTYKTMNKHAAKYFNYD